MKFERGFSLSQMMVWGILLVLLASVGIKVTPSAIEYYKTLAAAKSAAQNATPQSTVPEIRRAYAKQAEVDHLKVIKPEDLDITKDGGQVVVNFNFTEKIPLVGPVSLLIEYQGSTAGKNKGE